MKLIHLLNHIYSDRICHIPSISQALLLSMCEDVQPHKVLNEPYLSLIIVGIL